MNYLSFLRKPLKSVLYSILVLAIALATVLFSLLSFIDTRVANKCIRDSAYICSISSKTAKYAMMKQVDKSVIQQLKESDIVSETMCIQTYSAKLDDLDCVIDCFGNTESLNNKLSVYGTVVSTPRLDTVQFGRFEEFTIKIKSSYGMGWDGLNVFAWILHDKAIINPTLKQGDSVLLTGRYNSNFDGHANGIYVIDSDFLETSDIKADSPIWNHPVYILSEGLTDEEALKDVENYIQDTDLIKYIDTSEKLKNIFTVNTVDDMSMLLTVANGSTFITRGRELNKNDYGKRVCVISDEIALVNNIDVGELINISISPSRYTYDSVFEEWMRWESGYPFEGDSLFEYPESEQFEVVGIYSETDRRMGALDYIHHNRNEIFVPSGLMPESSFSGNILARSFTFSVQGPKYDSSIDLLEEMMDNYGYTVTIVGTGWENVSKDYHDMNYRRNIMITCAVIAFIISGFLIILIVVNNSQKEYAMRRYMGESHKEAKKVFYTRYFTSVIPALLLSIPLCFAAYKSFIKNRFYLTLTDILPNDNTVLLYIVSNILIVIIIMFSAVVILGSAQRKRNLINLIKN